MLSVRHLCLSVCLEAQGARIGWLVPVPIREYCTQADPSPFRNRHLCTEGSLQCSVHVEVGRKSSSLEETASNMELITPYWYTPRKSVLSSGLEWNHWLHSNLFPEFGVAVPFLAQNWMFWRGAGEAMREGCHWACLCVLRAGELGGGCSGISAAGWVCSTQPCSDSASGLCVLVFWVALG